MTVTGPILKAEQIKAATGSCQSTCTPSNTNDVNVVFCCFAQNNCNNLFGYVRDFLCIHLKKNINFLNSQGPHHNGGHSTEHGVGGGFRFGGKGESHGIPRSTAKPTVRSSGRPIGK